jgi:hypothetical protein
LVKTGAIMNAFKKYNFVWITSILFLGSLIGHWVFAWQAYVDHQSEMGLPVEVSDYIHETSRDTLENWQSEFLQLIWQVVGLSFLYYIGSSQSKEGDDRKEAKIDFLMKKLYGDEGATEIERLNKKYPKK